MCVLLPKGLPISEFATLFFFKENNFLNATDFFGLDTETFFKPKYRTLKLQLEFCIFKNPKIQIHNYPIFEHFFLFSEQYHFQKKKFLNESKVADYFRMFVACQLHCQKSFW